MRILTILMVIGCGSSGIVDCDPSVYLDAACASTERCDATTRKCEAATSCSLESECSGYACAVSSVCERNCRGQIGPDDSFCATGYTCNSSHACVTGVACSDDAPCGAYACDLTSGSCRLACTGDSQCSTGKSCDTGSHTCK